MIRIHLSLVALLTLSFIQAEDNWNVSPEGTFVYKMELQEVLKNEAFDNTEEPVSAICSKTIAKEKRYLESSDVAYETDELKKLITFRQNTPGFGLLLLITPEEAPALYRSLRIIAQRLGIQKLPLVYVNHAATKAVNAFAYSVFEGGPCLVILNASLINAADDQIIEAIIAHELVHITHHDSIQKVHLKEALTAVGIGVFLYSVYRAYKQWNNPSLSQSKLARAGYIAQLLLIEQAYDYASLLCQNVHSQSFELRADRECAQALESGIPMINALQFLEEPTKESYIQADASITKQRDKLLELAQAQPTAFKTFVTQCYGHMYYYSSMISLHVQRLLNTHGLGSHPTNKTRIQQLRSIDAQA